MLIVAIALTVFWLENWRQTFYGGLHHEGFFAAYRSLDLVNGVAPTIPFALVVFALISWAWIHLRRLRMLAAGPRSVPSLGTTFLERTRAALLVAQIDRVTDAVQNPFLFPMWVYAVGLTAMATLYVVTSEYTQSLELRPFDVLYGVAFSVVILLLVLTCGRMVLIWTRLRAALKTIDLHPVRATFETTPLADSWGPILHRGIDLDHLERRYRELLGKSVDESAQTISDSSLEEVRAKVLDPAWARGDIAGGDFKINSELFALRYVAFIQANCRQIENLLSPYFP
jgi:hypothetical protein